MVFNPDNWDDNVINNNRNMLGDDSISRDEILENKIKNNQIKYIESKRNKIYDVTFQNDYSIGKENKNQQTIFMTNISRESEIGTLYTGGIGREKQENEEIQGKVKYGKCKEDHVFEIMAEDRNVKEINEEKIGYESDKVKGNMLRGKEVDKERRENKSNSERQVEKNACVINRMLHLERTMDYLVKVVEDLKSYMKWLSRCNEEIESKISHKQTIELNKEQNRKINNRLITSEVIEIDKEINQEINQQNRNIIRGKERERLHCKSKSRIISIENNCEGNTKYTEVCEKNKKLRKKEDKEGKMIEEIVDMSKIKEINTIKDKIYKAKAENIVTKGNNEKKKMDETGNDQKEEKNDESVRNNGIEERIKTTYVVNEKEDIYQNKDGNDLQKNTEDINIEEKNGIVEKWEKGKLTVHIGNKKKEIRRPKKIWNQLKKFCVLYGWD